LVYTPVSVRISIHDNAIIGVSESFEIRVANGVDFKLDRAGGKGIPPGNI